MIIEIGIFLLISVGSLIATYISFNERHTSNQSKITDTIAQNPPKEKVAEDAYNGSGVPDQISKEVLDTYLECLQPADDQYDDRFQTDYEYFDLVQITKCHDSKAYEKVFGYQDVSLEDIKKALEKNEHISQKYKDFIYEYAVRVRELYPEANLSVLYYNLQTLKVKEMTQDEKRDPRI